MNFRIATSIVPVVIFYLLWRVGPTWLAVGGSFAASAVVFAYTRRDRLTGALTLFGFVIVAGTAAVAIAWDNEKAYLAAGAVSDFLLAPVHIISALMGRPLVGRIAHEMFPAYTRKVEADARVFVLLSFAWGVSELLHGVLKLFLLNTLSVGEYLVWSRVLGMPPTALMIGLSIFMVDREARRRGRVAALATSG